MLNEKLVNQIEFEQLKKTMIDVISNLKFEEGKNILLAVSDGEPFKCSSCEQNHWDDIRVLHNADTSFTFELAQSLIQQTVVRSLGLGIPNNKWGKHKDQ